jgi:hemerythrin-like domain-containing protein
MSAIEQVATDLYNDVHKGIRRDLFALTERAGNLDPSFRTGRVDLAAHLDRTVELLVKHAHHEDTYVQPSIERHLPDVAAQIEKDHERLESRLVDLQGMAYAATDAMQSAQRFSVHRLYVELASFTSDYLAHQDLEERVVMPALEKALGPDAVLGIHGAIVSSIPPADMAKALSLMLPAMNIDERAELLGGIRVNAPAPVFEGVWGLAGSLLAPPDYAARGARLQVAA